MNILLLTATTLEVEPLLARGMQMDHLLAGVGAPATIFHLTKTLQQKKYDLVLQAGIAGSFDAGTPPGECVLVKRDCFADLGIFENNDLKTLAETGLAEKDNPMSGWLENTHTIFDDPPLKVVDGITVNLVSDHNLGLNALLHKKYNATVESMEGAALHYVCLQQQIHFLQLRSISNMIGERDKTQWKMKDAIKSLDQGITTILAHLQ